MEVPETEVHVKVGGPLLVERRALLWPLPRMAANDRATHSFEVRWPASR